MSTFDGLFIAFEGGEGSGKSRHSRFVAEWFKSEGYEVVHTLEPGGSEIGQQIRSVILSEHPNETLGHRGELFLFLADRAHHIDAVIRPALERGAVVICDRFSGSTFAYQLGGRELPNAEFVTEMDAYARAGLQPDLVMYLDISPEEGLRRRMESKEQKVNRLDKEALDFHTRVHNHFVELAEQDHWRTVSTEGPKEENSKRILQAVQEYFNLDQS